MDFARLTCFRHPDWEYRVGDALLDAGNVGHLAVPGGVFCATDGTNYFPTVDGIDGGKASFKHNLSVGLVEESESLSKPVSMVFGGFGQKTLTNTGSEPLTVGQRFTVEWPTETERRAQRECVKMAFTQQSHSRLSDTVDLWGGFLATVGSGKSAEDTVVARVNRELHAGEQSNTLYMAVGKLMHCAGAMADGVRGPETFYRGVVGGTGTASAVTAARLAMKNNFGAYSQLATAAAELVNEWEPRIYGYVQRSTLGNSTVVPPGGQFFGFVYFR